MENKSKLSIAERKEANHEKMKSHRLAMAEYIKAHLDTSNLQELAKRCDTSEERIQTILSNVTFVDIVQLSRVYTNLKDIVEKYAQRQTDKDALNPQANTNIELQHEDPYDNPDLMKITIRSFISSNYSTIYQIADLSGLPPEKVADIISDKEKEITIEELNKMYGAVKSIQDAEEELSILKNRTKL